jgi:hypothetical protein
MAELRGLLEAHMDRPDVITDTVEFKPGEPAAINLLTHVVGAPLPPTAGPRHERPSTASWMTSRGTCVVSSTTSLPPSSRPNNGMSARNWFGRLMDRIADDDEWSRTLLGVMVAVTLIVAVWIATGIFWLDR